MKAGFGEDAPGEDQEDPYNRFYDGEQPPGCDVGNGRVSRTGLWSLEELGGYTILKESPATQNFSQNDGHEGNGVFEARAIVDGLGVLIHHEQADCSRSDGDCRVSVYLRLPRQKKKKMRLAYPTTIFDGLSNSFQVKMLEKPDGGTDDDPEGTVGERMHGSVYASENDAKGIENDGSKIAVVAR